MADYRVGGEDWAGLCTEVQVGPSVERRSLVQETELGCSTGRGWLERGADLKLKALGELVLEFELGVELVCGSPSLRQSQTIWLVRPLGFDFSRNWTLLGLCTFGGELLKMRVRRRFFAHICQRSLRRC